jgi:hypothetical protein
VGKSLIAQFCVIAARGAGQDPRIVEYDRQPKQRRWFPGETESFPLTPDLGSLLATPEKLAGFWDPMIEWLCEDRGLVVDFGAQAWELFEQWAVLSGLSSFHDGSGVLVITPVTADIEAVEGAARVLEALPRLMPKARVLLLTLDKDGPVDSLVGLPEYDQLVAAARTSGTVTLRALPVLRAEGWSALAARGLRLDQIVAPGGVSSSRDWMRAAYGVFLPHLHHGDRRLSRLLGWMSWAPMTGHPSPPRSR